MKKIASLCVAFGLALSPCSSYASSSIKAKTNIKSTSTVNNESSFDKALKKTKAASQKDSRWKNWQYMHGNYKTTLDNAGCKPLSILNALILTFGIDDSNQIQNILKNIISIDPSYKNINDYLFHHNNKKCQSINALLNGKKIINGGKSSKDLLTTVSKTKLNDNTYILGTTGFNTNHFNNIINMIKNLYKINPDTNIIFYGMSAGYLSLERAFGSITNHGHYVTLLINVREFIENRIMYFIDSVPRNLKGESNHRVNYNFVEKPNKGKLQSFNKTFKVQRINEQILKLTTKKAIDKNILDLLGLDGGCGVIICLDNIASKKDIYQLNNTSYYDYEEEKVYVKRLG